MISGRCAACKYLRRRCALDCIFSPYFPSNDPQRFACVHRIYGASNVAKMLQQIPDHLRDQATDTLYCEAQSRIQDPVYGCVGVISQLHQQIQNAETELAMTRAQIALFLTSNNNTINHGHNNVGRQEQGYRFQEQQIGGEPSSNATFLPGEFDPNNSAPNSWFL